MASPDDESDPEPSDLGVEDGTSVTDFDHADLVSLLAEHDLAFATDPRRAPDAEFAFDPDADPDEVFPQSVSSGGPTPTGVILWTRIAPGAFDEDERVGVEVARGESFADPVFRGVVEDPARVAAHDYTIKVDLDGALEPDTEYRYRFVYAGTASRVGRCRTLPAPDASPESVSFAVLTCQNYLNGYYGALHHVAQEDVDFVIHVGDFIYESDEGAFKGFGSRDYEGRDKDLPSGEKRVDGLEDYRYLYRTYQSDPLLQEMLEAHTLLPAWDDHEFADDIYWDPGTDAPKAHHPRSDDPEFMTQLVADAMHAWWEYMPARVDYDPSARRLQDRFELWRSFDFGDLVDLIMTDERLFRDPPLEGIPTKYRTAPENTPDDRSMLGEAQRKWFLDEVRDETATWTVWSDEVLTVPCRLGAGPLTIYPVQGGWDGYKREREYISTAIEAADPDNFVTLTGDMHCYVAGYKKTAYGDRIDHLLGRAPGPAARIGVEFMTPPTTSQNVAEALGLNYDPTGITRRLMSGIVRLFNPHIEYFDSHNWGYSVVEFTREDCTYVGYAVDKTVDGPDAEKETLVALRVPEGDPEIEDVTDRYLRE